MTSGKSFCSRFRGLEISNTLYGTAESNAWPAFTSQTHQSIQLGANTSQGTKHTVREMLETAVACLPYQCGSKEDILRMIASLYPDFELTNQFLQSSLDQAFSKYLQSQPARLKLIGYEIDREEEYRDT